MNFEDCLMACAGNRELVSEFNRLSGFHLGETRTPIEVQIDTACGYDPDQEAILHFLDFIFEFIWLPLLAQEK